MKTENIQKLYLGLFICVVFLAGGLYAHKGYTDELYLEQYNTNT